MERKDEELDFCGVNVIHEDALARVRSALPDDGALSGAADFFKMFADPTRMRILCALLSAELCVCDLTCLMGVSQSAVSHQLRLLRNAHLVKTRREGKSIFYSLDDEHVLNIIKQAIEHAAHEAAGR